MQDKAKAYSREKHRLAIINILLSPAVLILLIIAGVPAYLKGMSVSISSNDYVNLLIFSILIGLIYSALMSPLAYYSGFKLEHKFLLSNQTFADWIKREIKKAVVSFIVSIPLIISLYAFIKYSPIYWWLFTALAWFFISVIVAKFTPVVIVPLFYRYSRIKDNELNNRLSNLAKREGFDIEGVYEINMSKDTKKANAALMGIGRQKRIVLCDTLLKNFSNDEIVSVMGHELGHHKLRHVLKLIVAGGILSLALFFITNIVFFKFHNITGYLRLYEFESLVMIYAIISILNIFALPIENAFSRKLEKDADAFALRITGNKSAFISTMKKLAEQNLADANPARFYEIMLYNHPPIARRIAFAESFESKSIS